MDGFIILLGDFNVKFPRRYKNIIDPFAHRTAGRKLRQRTKQLLQLFETNGLCVPSTYFKPKRRQTYHTWRGSKGRGQIDYIAASRRWRSCFLGSKVYWSAQRYKSGTKTDHGLLAAKFRWRVRQRKKCATTIDWARLKPYKGKQGTNPILEIFEKKYKDLWEVQSAETATAINADSQDGTGLRRQGLRAAAGVSSEPTTCMTIGPSSVRVGTGVVIGTGNDLDRASRDTDDSLRGRGLLATGVTSAPTTDTATGPSSV